MNFPPTWVTSFKQPFHKCHSNYFYFSGAKTESDEHARCKRGGEYIPLVECIAALNKIEVSLLKLKEEMDTGGN